jgi:GH24 family phage-related lysozyme (muramidase)
MNIEKLKEHLKEEEGYRNKVYKDHLGFATIGYGHLIKKNENFV